MMRWIDQELFDDLVLTNRERAEAIVRNAEPLLNEVLPFIPDATLQYRIYHDETEHTNYLECVSICFTRNDILFGISKQSYPKTTFRIFCCCDDDLRHVDNHSKTAARDGLPEPQRIGKLSKRKVEAWIAYQTRYYRNLARIDEQNRQRIRDHIARLELIPDVVWAKDRQSGSIERRGICYSFQVERTGISENIRLTRYGHSLDGFLDMARPYEPKSEEKSEKTKYRRTGDVHGWHGAHDREADSSGS